MKKKKKIKFFFYCQIFLLKGRPFTNLSSGNFKKEIIIKLAFKLKLFNRYRREIGKKTRLKQNQILDGECNTSLVANLLTVNVKRLATSLKHYKYLQLHTNILSSGYLILDSWGGGSQNHWFRMLIVNCVPPLIRQVRLKKKT